MPNLYQFLSCSENGVDQSYLQFYFVLVILVIWTALTEVYCSIVKRDDCTASQEARLAEGAVL